MITNVLLLTAILGLDLAEAEKTIPPNIVMIISDDQGWTDFGFMGHDVIRTPHLDKLASQSAVFVNGYVPSSLCRASLATLLTGLYGHEHKICCNDPPPGVDRAAMLPFMRDAPTVPRLLKEVGYRSLQTGKFWEGHYSNAGFTHGMTENKEGGRHGDTGLLIGRQTMQPIYDFIDQSGEKPFFIWYAPMMPHLPHDPPERYLKEYAVEGREIELAKYWAMCEWFDQTCGELLASLDKKGLSDNTLVVFVVDNGWIQQTRPGYEGFGGIRSKMTPYDAGVRTPILLRWPRHISPGRREQLVSTIDLAPTILKACQVKPPPRMSGMNLIDVAAGKQPGRKAVFGEIFKHEAVDLEKPALSLTHRWVREGDWKLIVFEDKAKAAGPELYDLAHDPTEEKTLADDHPEKIRHLRGILDAWWNGKAENP